jgi:hypothetical protein
VSRRRRRVGQRRDLRGGWKVTSEPPGELVGDDRLNQVRTTHGEVDGDRRAGARPDHDGRWGLQVPQQRCGVGRMGEDRAYGCAAGAGVAAAVVADHLADPGELLTRGAPGRGRRPGRGNQEDRGALARHFVVEVASIRPHGIARSTDLNGHGISTSLTWLTVVRSATYWGTSASAASSLSASTVHQIACPPERHDENVDRWRSGLACPLKEANTTPHSCGWWRCWST